MCIRWNPSSCNKALVHLYLCKNKEKLEQHLLKDEGIRALCEYYIGESKAFDASDLHKALESHYKNENDTEGEVDNHLIREAVLSFIEPEYESDKITRIKHAEHSNIASAYLIPKPPTKVSVITMPDLDCVE